MRYTLTNKAIAVLLSAVLLIGSASGFSMNDEDENKLEVTNSLGALDYPTPPHQNLLESSDDDGNDTSDDLDTADKEPINSPCQDELEGCCDNHSAEPPDFDTLESGNTLSDKPDGDKYEGRLFASLDLQLLLLQLVLPLANQFLLPGQLLQYFV